MGRSASPAHILCHGNDLLRVVPVGSRRFYLQRGVAQYSPGVTRFFVRFHLDCQLFSADYHDDLAALLVDGRALGVQAGLFAGSGGLYHWVAALCLVAQSAVAGGLAGIPGIWRFDDYECEYLAHQTHLSQTPVG